MMFSLLIALALPVAEELASGPQVGATVPGQFLTLPINGPDAGDETCLYCKYGNAPVVMIFTAKPSEELAKLVKSLEAAVATAAEECGVCAIVTDPSAEAKKSLGLLAEKGRFKRVVLAVVEPDRIKDYAVNPKAGITIVIYSRKVVRINEAFRAGTLDEKAISRLTAAATKHLSAK